MRYQEGDPETKIRRSWQAWLAQPGLTRRGGPPLLEEEWARQRIQAHLDLETPDQEHAYRVLRTESILDAFPDEFLPSHAGQTHQQFKSALGLRRRHRHHPLRTH